MKPFVPRAFLAAAVVALSSGCASIVGGTSQVVSVEALDADRKVNGAQCALKNPKGEYFVTAPGTVTVNRAYDDLLVRCELAGYDTGTASARSTTKAMAFGNIIFGGVVGGAVDIASGAAYEYPSMITVQMRALAGSPKSGDTAKPGPAPAQTVDAAAALPAATQTPDGAAGAVPQTNAVQERR